MCAYTPTSCVGPADYLGGERRAIFEIGSSVATVEYSTVNDTIREGNESFIANLTVPPEMQAMGIVRGIPDRATVNIIDDEGKKDSLHVCAQLSVYMFMEFHLTTVHSTLPLFPVVLLKIV